MSASRRIPLPGLPHPDSQLGVPLLVRGELVGVLCIESEQPYRFHEEDKATIELLGSYLAMAIQNIEQSSAQTVAAMQQVERAARDLNELSQRLSQTVQSSMIEN